MEKKMEVEIWSDIVCPFCYIGKRELEKAMEGFEGKDDVRVIWKSYKLMPDMQENNNKSAYEYFAGKYGVSIEQAKATHDNVAQRARGLGLDYNFDIAVPVNTSKAHQLLHYAKEMGKQDAAEEVLFRSYFTEGKNLEDMATLLEIGAALGLDEVALKNVIESGQYNTAVNADIQEAQEIGVRGVPFFVFDRKYAISGAQESKSFRDTLEQSFAEWKKENEQD